MKTTHKRVAFVACALATLALAHDDILDGPDNRTPAEYMACWSDLEEPECHGDEYLDRSGLEGKTAPEPFVDGENNDNCVCRKLAEECPENAIWDYVNERCQCVQMNDCATNYYFDYNTCQCHCQPFVPGCEVDGKVWSHDACQCVCPPSAEPEPLPHTHWAWNGQSCTWDCTELDLDGERCSGLDTADNKYFYSTTTCTCEFLWQNCPPGFYFDATDGICRCAPTVCGPNQFYDNSYFTEAMDTDGCRCRCTSQVCPDNYIFNNESCECQCIEPPHATIPDTGACVDWTQNGVAKAAYWSTDTCECVCSPQECAEGTFWDNSKCECSCSPEVCEPGLRWDFSTCLCHCCPDEPCANHWYYNTVSCRCEQDPQQCAVGYFWYVHADGSGMCTQNPEDCGADHFWDFEIGQCVCNELPCVADHFWSGYDCACLCVPQTCTDPETEYWDMQACVCLPVPYLCEMNKFYDQSVGECICRPQVCGSDEIFDDIECVCRCKPETCPQNYFWSENHCDCQCLEPLDAEACGPDMWWDNEHCKCVCAEPIGEGACDANHYWDHECCECLCLPSVEGGLEGQFWNTRTCRWECESTECPAGEYWFVPEDGLNCECRCLAHECDEGYYWNIDTCCCDCLEQDCPSTHYWDANDCECKCNIQTSCGEGEYWNTCACQCVCAPPTLGCDAGFYWDETTCLCQCVFPSISDFDSHPGQWFDSENCEWRDIPSECPPGTYWSPADDLCYCLDQTCQYPYSWDGNHPFPEFCGCVCADDILGTDAYNEKLTCESNPGYEWNHDRCECQLCEVEVCPERDGHVQFWNPNCCECQCTPWLECPDSSFNFDLCDCDPVIGE